MELRVGGPELTVNDTGPLLPSVVMTLTVVSPGAALAAMVKLAVIWVVSTTVTPLTVTPALATMMVAPGMKLAPDKVPGTVAPCAPFDGLMELMVGTAGITVKDTGPLIPPEVVTVTFVPPSVALAAILKVAVICVALTTVTPLTVTPALATLTVAPEMKPVPVKVTRTVAPRARLDGLIEVTFGPPGITVKDNGPLVPPDVVTVTLVGPVVALAAMVKVAVIWLALTTVTPLTVMPALATLTLAPEIKLLPVNVTGTPLPSVPFGGLM